MALDDDVDMTDAGLFDDDGDIKMISPVRRNPSRAAAPQTPNARATAPQAPNTRATAAQASTSRAGATTTRAASTSRAGAPQAPTSRTAAPQTPATRAAAAQASSSKTPVPQTSASRAAPPRASSARTVAPQTPAPRTGAPQTPTSRTGAPQASSSRTAAPQASLSRAAAHPPPSSKSAAPQNLTPRTAPPQTPAARAIALQVAAIRANAANAATSKASASKAVAPRPNTPTALTPQPSGRTPQSRAIAALAARISGLPKTKASFRLFQDGKLMKKIFSHLSGLSLFKIQRVKKSFRATIVGSELLQEKMWLRRQKVPRIGGLPKPSSVNWVLTNYIFLPRLAVDKGIVEGVHILLMKDGHLEVRREYDPEYPAPTTHRCIDLTNKKASWRKMRVHGYDAGRTFSRIKMLYRHPHQRAWNKQAVCKTHMPDATLGPVLDVVEGVLEMYWRWRVEGTKLPVEFEKVVYVPPKAPPASGAARR